MTIQTWNDTHSTPVSGDGAAGSVAPIHEHEHASRAWPPVMIRDFLRPEELGVIVVHVDSEIGDMIDFLAASPGAVAAVVDEGLHLLGIDDDVMAMIKRDGIKSAMEKSAREAIQRRRPVCSITDSPYVILQEMKDQGWDRIGVAEHGQVVGVVHRRDLVRFVEH